MNRKSTTVLVWVFTAALGVSMIYDIFLKQKPNPPIPAKTQKSCQSLVNYIDSVAPLMKDAGADDDELESLDFIHSNPRFVGATVKVRNSDGQEARGQFASEPLAMVKDDEGRSLPESQSISIASPGNLTTGPFLVTVLDRDDKAIAVFRVDRTGNNRVDIMLEYILSIEDGPGNPAHLSLAGFADWQPLGREKYLQSW